MAAHGYERERFESTVVSTERYKCPICLNVVKDPVMCRRNEHPFCRGCITSHLTNDQTCPVCKDYLTHDTLKKPSRFLTEPLSELRIRCEFVERGCEEIVQLQNLEKHVGECGYAPVPCSNEGCQREVNRRDLTYHEYEECEHRKVKCHCKRLSKDVDILKQNMTGMQKTFETAWKNVYTALEKVESLQKYFEDLQENMDVSVGSLKRSNRRIERNLKKLMKGKERHSKKSRTETDNDDSDLDSSGSEAGSVCPECSPSRPASVTTVARAESNSSPSASILSQPTRVHTVPSADNNFSLSSSIPSRFAPVSTVPRAENSSLPSSFTSLLPANVNAVPRSESNYSTPLSLPFGLTSVTTVPKAECNSSSIPLQPTCVNTVPSAESNSPPSSSIPSGLTSVDAVPKVESVPSPTLSSSSSSDNTLPESNYSPPLSSPFGLTSVTTVPSAEGNSLPSSSIPSGLTSVDAVPNFESVLSPTLSSPSSSSSGNTLPESNYSPPLSTSSWHTSVQPSTP